MSTPSPQTSLPAKRDVRRSFDSAAASYDDNAFLQREIAGRLMERFELIRLKPARTLDLGCGTGEMTLRLRKRDPDAEIVAMDLAPAMLHATRAKCASPWWKRLGRATPATHLIAGDAEAIPLDAESIDLAVSNLTLQWCNPETVAREMARILKPEGLFMFTTFGPDTLKELRAAFKAVDDHPHVNTFVDMHDIGDILVSAGFADPVMDQETITITYTELKTLLRELKGIGAHNVLPDRAQGLMSRTRWQQLVSAYDQFRRDGKLPATYEVVYGHAWKPALRRQSAVDGASAVSLEEFRRMVKQK